MKEMKQKLESIDNDIEWIENALKLLDSTFSMLDELKECKNLKYIQSKEHMKGLLRKYGQYRGMDIDSVFDKIGESKSRLWAPHQLLQVMKYVLEQEKRTIP